MTDIVERLRGLRFVHVPVASGLMEEAAAEIERLRLAIRRLAEQDATLSVQGGSVTVTLDATLTDEERAAIETAVRWLEPYPPVAATLRSLLARTNHDAAPEAIASPSESSVPLGNGGGCGGIDKPVTLPAMGTGDIPVSRTQGRVGTILSEAEIDALEYVVEEGRIASMDDYGILRSLLVRLRPEWEHQSYEESDEKRVNTNTNRDTTPSEGSVRGEGTLTAEERAAIYRAEARLRAAYVPDDETAATLRSLLARLHSTPQTHPTLS
jgi:hypothetical protein